MAPALKHRLKLIRQQEAHQQQRDGGQADHHHPAHDFEPDIRFGGEGQGGGNEMMQAAAAFFVETGFDHFRCRHKYSLMMEALPGKRHGVFSPGRRLKPLKLRMGKTPHGGGYFFRLSFCVMRNKKISPARVLARFSPPCLMDFSAIASRP